MKKTMLSSALAALCMVSYADNVPTSANSNTPNTNPSVPVIQTAPVSTTPPVIDCKYHIPATSNNIDQNTIITWAKKAAVQSFDFNPTTIDSELTILKDCYTEQGWQGFNDALQKSGNITAIKEQHLTVSSQVDGQVNINQIKDNQWKATVPMQVVYQNDKEKLTQLLTVDLLIGRKVSGDLGIMQMIATPRQMNQPAAAPANATPAVNNPAPANGAPATATPNTQQTAPAGQH